MNNWISPKVKQEWAVAMHLLHTFWWFVIDTLADTAFISFYLRAPRVSFWGCTIPIINYIYSRVRSINSFPLLKALWISCSLEWYLIKADKNSCLKISLGISDDNNSYLMFYISLHTEISASLLYIKTQLICTYHRHHHHYCGIVIIQNN